MNESRNRPKSNSSKHLRREFSDSFGTFSKLLNKAVYDGGQLPAIAFGRFRHRKSSIRKELCERRTLGTHALNCPPAKSQNEKVPVARRGVRNFSITRGQVRAERCWWGSMRSWFSFVASCRARSF